MSINQDVKNPYHQNKILNSSDPFSELKRRVEGLIREKETTKYEFNKFRIESEEETKKFLLELLEVVDAFERLFNIIKERGEKIDQQTKIWIGNFRTIYKLLLRALREFGISQIDTLRGDQVNPHVHSVVELVQKAGQKDGTIVEIIKKGYWWKDKILRPVEVKVVKND
jgi:molecular chaperone GrpE